MLKKILQSKWFIAPALILIGFLAISLIKLEPALVTARKETSNLDKKIAELNRSIVDFEKVGDYLKSDSYLEKQARLKLNYKKADENVVYIYTKESGGQAEPKVAADRDGVVENKLIMNLKSWWKYLIE